MSIRVFLELINYYINEQTSYLNQPLRYWLHFPVPKVKQSTAAKTTKIKFHKTFIAPASFILKF